MPLLDKNLFTGIERIDPTDISRGELRNFASDVTDKLAVLGWDQKGMCGCIGLSLTTDNRYVEKGTFFVRGSVKDQELKIEANKIWGEASSNVHLLLKFPSVDMFNFSEGGLSSDLLSQEEVQHGLYEANEDSRLTNILEADYEKHGIGEFCIRMSCTLAKSSSVKKGAMVKFTILLFPDSKQALLDTYELAQSPAWPGIRVTEGDIPLLPKPSTQWMCPVIPLTLSGTPYADLARMPSAEDLRRAIAAIMGTGGVVETARTGPSLVARWKKAANNQEELALKEGPVTWPDRKSVV